MALDRRELMGANPRFLLANGIPAGPVRDPAAWRPHHEQRMRGAIAAARRITPAG